MESAKAEMARVQRMSRAEKIALFKGLRDQYKGVNLTFKHLKAEDIERYDEKDQEKLLQIIQSSLILPTSKVGCYVTCVDDYKRFSSFLHPLLADYHALQGPIHHEVDFGFSQLPQLRESLGLSEVYSGPPMSMRMRLARNVEGFEYTSCSTVKERLRLETHLRETAISTLLSRFGGQYRRVGEDKAADERYCEAHLNMVALDEDKHLVAAGIASDYPTGRGYYIDANEEINVWVGEEDHIRIIVLLQSTELVDLYAKMEQVLTCFSSVTFASFEGGYSTTCPSNCGSGMRISVHLPVPKLLQDREGLKERVKAMQCQARSSGGESKEDVEAKVVDISPSIRMGVCEKDIVRILLQAIHQLLVEERNKPQ